MLSNADHELMQEKIPTNNFDLVFGDLDLQTWFLALSLVTFFSDLVPDIDIDLGDLDLWPSNFTFGLDLVTSDVLYGQYTEKHNFNLCPWPLTLTFESILAGVKFKLHAKYQGRRSKHLALWVLTNKQTNK